jgi:signal transduction histidine kinase
MDICEHGSSRQDCRRQHGAAVGRRPAAVAQPESAGPGMPAGAEAFLDRLSPRHALYLGAALLVMIGLLEYALGPQISISIFYIIPIALVVWRVGGPWAGAMPAVCAVCWWLAERAAGRVYSHWEIGLWNAVIRLGFFFIFARLITWRQRYAVEKTAHEAAEENSRLKSNLMALVSHEYGNTLTNLKLATLILQQSEPSPVAPSRENAYQVLVRAVEHLRVSTSSFLNLNRIEAGHLKLDFRPTPIQPAVGEAVAFLQPVITGKELRLKTELPQAPLTVRADGEALSIILSNLVTNAVKYTPNGGAITIRVVRAPGRPARARVEVEDSGIGISAQDQERILSGYYRTEESRKAAHGFGIGLMLIKELIERHGSRLEISSAPGRGSRFSFQLPICQPGSPAGEPR